MERTCGCRKGQQIQELYDTENNNEKRLHRLPNQLTVWDRKSSPKRLICGAKRLCICVD
jgi:hypothetical protein